MKSPKLVANFLVSCIVLSGAGGALAEDWPQWRGPNRDGKVSGFAAPATWPKELTKKWKKEIGLGADSTPALVGDKLYVAARQGGNEVILCMDAASGEEKWRDQYPTPEVRGNGGGPHGGPRCTPAVADGKLVTLGATGILSCYDLAGKQLWRKDEFPNVYPRFYVASSPLIADGLVVAALGGSNNGGIIAYDINNGEQKWKWTGDGPGYSSPVVATFGGVKQVVVLTEKKLVSVALADGKLLFELPFAVQGRGYNVATPIVEGNTIIYTGSGRGAKAIEVSKQGETFTTKELWSNPEASVTFSTPVLKDGLLFAVSDRGSLFCINAKTGANGWTDTVRRERYGAMLDVGPAVFALTQKSQLTVIQPDEKAFKELASIKVADKDTFAHPVVNGKQIYIRDLDSITLWTVE